MRCGGDTDDWKYLQTIVRINRINFEDKYVDVERLASYPVKKKGIKLHQFLLILVR